MEFFIPIITQVQPPDNVLYAYGPLGVGVFFLGIFVWKLFKIILNDRDKAMQQRDALLEQFFTKVIPSITKVTEYLEDRKDLDKELIDSNRESSIALKKNTELMQEILIIIRSGRTGGS